MHVKNKLIKIIINQTYYSSFYITIVKEYNFLKYTFAPRYVVQINCNQLKIINLTFWNYVTK